MTGPVRLLLVDDHPVFLDGMVALFEDEPWAQVVGTARTAAEALARTEASRPDVAVVDLRLPDLDGVELTRRLLARSPSLRVLLLTMHAGQDAVLRGLGAGAAAAVRGQLDDGGPLPALSARDRELLDLLARGLPTAEIGLRLSLAPKTVRNRLSELFAVLGVASRAEAIVLARTAGLGRPGPVPGRSAP